MKPLLLLLALSSPTWYDVEDTPTPIPQAQSNKPDDWPDDPPEPPSNLFTFNENYTEPQPQPQLIGLAPCPSCPGSQWQSLIPKNLRNNPNIVWQNKTMRGCPGYPAVYDPLTKMYYRGAYLQSQQALESGIQRQAELKGIYQSQELVLGEIDANYLREARKWLGSSGSIKLGNRQESADYNSFLAVRLPANFACSWQSNGPETKISFSTKPSLRVKIVDQFLSGIVLTDNSIKLNIDWFPDITINGTGNHPPESEPVTVICKSVRTRIGYPIRRGWWTHPGDIRQHLQIGEHRGKWSVEILNQLSYPELESLHSDDHEGRVKPFIQVPIQ